MFVLNRLSYYIYYRIRLNSQCYELLKRKIRRYQLHTRYRLNNLNYYGRILILSHEIDIYMGGAKFQFEIIIHRYSKTMFGIEAFRSNTKNRKSIYIQRINSNEMKKLYIALKSIVRKKDNYQNYYRYL
jgi:hypothetical protein